MSVFLTGGLYGICIGIDQINMGTKYGNKIWEQLNSVNKIIDTGNKL